MDWKEKLLLFCLIALLALVKWATKVCNLFCNIAAKMEK